MYKLKSVVFVLLSLLLGCQSQKATMAPSAVNMYVGTYTGKGSQGIYLVQFDTVTGALANDTLVAEIPNPSYLSLSHNRRFLAAVSEDGSRLANLYTFSVDSATGFLSPLSHVQTGGFGPCYVSIFNDSVVCTANYRSGSVCFTKVDVNGQLRAGTLSLTHQGTGPNVQRQEAPHAHCIVPDLDGRFVYSADLGADKIYVYKIEADTVIPVKEIGVTAGFGPRHIAFHPGRRLMAVVNELVPSVELYAAGADGVFSVKKDSEALLPDSSTVTSTAADIHFSDDGRFVYVTNRGVDFVAVLAVDETNLSLGMVERLEGMLEWPRNFAIDPSGKFVLVANQNGHSIVVFSRNAQTGKLTDTGKRLKINSPVCLKF